MGPETVNAVPDGLKPPAGQLPLIRYSHIFSSAVRDFLEIKLLRAVTDEHVTPRQLQLLRYIDLDHHHHVDDVAKFLEISAPAATKAVDVLERRSLVARSSSGDDRRLRVLSCSEKGKQLLARYRSLEAERVGAVLTRFSEGDIADLTRLLERYSLALIEAENSSGMSCFRCAGYFDSECPVQFVHSNCPYQQRSEERQ